MLLLMISKVGAPAALHMYGVFHLLWVLLGIPAAVAVAYGLRKMDGGAGKRFLTALWIVFFVSEIYKQLYLTFAVGHGEYQYWYFPFQLCSMPLYLCLPAAYAKPGKFKSALCTFLCGFSILGGLLTLAFPEDLMNRPLSLTLHGFTWHILLIFLGCWLGFSGYGCTGRYRHNFLGACLVYLVCATLALGLNFALWEPSSQGINMFYLGPMPSTQPVFSAITEKIGWLGNLPIYMACEMLGCFLFSAPFAVYRNRRKAKQLTEDPTFTF